MVANIFEDFEPPSKNFLATLLHEPDIDKIYIYAKDPFEAKYQLLINKRERTSLKYLNHSKAFIKYSNCWDDICRNILKNIIQIKSKNILIG